MKVRKIVLTGGPCAGKTTLTEVIARVFHSEVVVVPEAATLLFRGGFPRWTETLVVEATQRAIYRVQLELEEAYSVRHPGKVLVLDRGTVDGAAYWPEGPLKFFEAMNSSLESELTRYSRVLYMESAAKESYLIHKMKNPNRIENWEEAQRLDIETRKLWTSHPQMSVIHNEVSFGSKITQVLDLVRAEI